MKRLALAFALAVAASLALLPGAAGAHHRHHVTVFIGHGHPFVHHPFLFHRHFFHQGFFPPSSTLIVVEPSRGPVWVPGAWQWNGFQWVWAPGQWIVPSQGLLLRNPCD